MAITKEKKKEIIEKIRDIAKDARSVVFVKFHGLPVSDTNLLRRSLKEKGVAYTVVKKTLVRRALADTDIKGELPALDGELALVSGLSAATARASHLSASNTRQAGAGGTPRSAAQAGDELIAPAREIYAFVKKFKENLSILGGIFEGRYMDKKEMEEVASVPALEVLYGQFVNIINSPIQGLVMVLNSIAEKKGV